MDAIPFNFNLATALAILVSVIGSLIVTVYNFGKLKQKFDSMESRFNSMESRFSSMESGFNSMESKFNLMESRFDSMESRFDSMESRFDSMESRFNNLENKHERRFERISEDLTSLKVSVGIIIENLGHVGDQIKDLSARMDKQEQKSDQLTQKFIDHLLEDDRS